MSKRVTTSEQGRSEETVCYRREIATLIRTQRNISSNKKRNQSGKKKKTTRVNISIIAMTDVNSNCYSQMNASLIFCPNHEC